MSLHHFVRRLLPRKLVNHFLELEEKDSDYVYTKSRFVLPTFLARLTGMREMRHDRRKRRFGRIKSSIFYYVTPPMMIITLVVVTAVTFKIETLYTYFNTGIYLNALIISLAIFAVLKTYYNAYLLFLAARFINKMEIVVNKDQVSESDVRGLLAFLEKKAVFLNTKYMANAVKNIGIFGHPNFSDTDVRLIKSKLGFRVSRKKSEVNFISGILVMLGLLGTFLGLLKTIDAVGQALAGMADIGGGEGNIGLDEMSSFIGSLAAPLQGMGLAFSSSLFGLSGSLMIGFFNYTSGAPQNEFIENFSRWLDDRIPSFDPKKTAKGEAQPRPASTDDLKTWLAGFVYLSVQTNRKLGKLIFALSKSVGETVRMSALLRDMAADQGHIRTNLETIGAAAVALRDQGQDSLAKIGSVADAVKFMGDSADALRQAGREMGETLPALSRKLDMIGESAAGLSRAMEDNLNTTRQGVELRARTDVEIRESLAEIGAAMRALNDTQSGLTAEIQALGRVVNVPGVEEASAVVLQLNGLLEQLGARNESLFEEIFGTFSNDAAASRKEHEG